MITSSTMLTDEELESYREKLRGLTWCDLFHHPSKLPVGLMMPRVGSFMGSHAVAILTQDWQIVVLKICKQKKIRFTWNVLTSKDDDAGLLILDIDRYLTGMKATDLIIT